MTVISKKSPSSAMKNIAAKVLYHNLGGVKFPGGVTVAGFQFDSVIRPAKLYNNNTRCVDFATRLFQDL